jgi:ATP/maltotriose-dependent transcriptional regulator MalT
VSRQAEIERGREAYARRAWDEAHAALAEADRAGALDVEDLELLGVTAYMLGLADEFLPALERAHDAHVAAGEPLRAARAAFYLGMNLAILGDTARAGGWFGRAQRLVEEQGVECPEQGYLLLPVAIRNDLSGDYEAAHAAASKAAELGRRFADRDLFALAAHAQGHASIKQGRLDDGLRLLDEAMLSVVAGELSPIVTGIVYCGSIAGCEEAYELRRAHAWTEALTRWWEEQPDLVAFTGTCLAHRAEILQLRGEWTRAIEEAKRARERCERATNLAAAGQALYQQAEVLRLQGELAPAEEAYREAHTLGREPQPGLALLRLAQGDTGAAAAGIRRALAETLQPLKRSRLLPAHAEIAIAAGELEEARAACRELTDIAKRFPSAMLNAIAAQVEGSVELAAGDPSGALIKLRQAWQAWQELEAPHEVARTRVLVALACRELGDEDSAALELQAARDTFERLGADPELARVAALVRGGEPADSHGLTPRELEVLRLVAAGRTNRQIAAVLVLSEHTVARHVQNIFTKLRVSSRTAATAFAFEHDLV